MPWRASSAAKDSRLARAGEQALGELGNSEPARNRNSSLNIKLLVYITSVQRIREARRQQDVILAQTVLLTCHAAFFALSGIERPSSMGGQSVENGMSSFAVWCER